MASNPEVTHRENADNPDHKQSVIDALARYMQSFDHGDVVRSEESVEIHGLIQKILRAKGPLTAEDLNRIVEDLKVKFATILNNSRVDALIKEEINQLQRAVIVYKLNYNEGK